jgi:superfamily I DNA/RNA helicase
MDERGLIDHGDQVVLSLRLLREHAAARDAISRRYRYLLVDEFQDMNSSQLEVIRHVASATGNITAVGDPDQAIYTFRGAAADNAAWFRSCFPAAEQIRLRRNYRSRQPILDAAARLVKHEPGAVDEREPLLADRRGRGSAAVRTMCFASPDEEADGVAEAISTAIGPAPAPLISRSSRAATAKWSRWRDRCAHAVYLCGRNSPQISLPRQSFGRCWPTCVSWLTLRTRSSCTPLPSAMPMTWAVKI